jgi:hypothetical protein
MPERRSPVPQIVPPCAASEFGYRPDVAANYVCAWEPIQPRQPKACSRSVTPPPSYLNPNTRSPRVGRVHLAGIPVRDEAVLELARLVDDPALADKLETAYARETRILALTIPERETILTALDDAPAGLEELRAVLLKEHVWRQAEGL